MMCLFFLGQMTLLENDHMIFLASPKLKTLSEMIKKKVFICDIPIHDTTREFLLLNQLRQAEIDIRYKYLYLVK